MNQIRLYTVIVLVLGFDIRVAEARACSQILFAGSFQTNVNQNGVYYLQDSLRNGRVWYKKQNAHTLELYWDGPVWIVTKDGAGTLSFRVEDVSNPSLITGTWSTGSAGADPAISTTCVPTGFSCVRVSNYGTVQNPNHSWDLYELKVYDSADTVLNTDATLVSFSGQNAPLSILIDGDESTLWSASGAGSATGVQWVQYAAPFDIARIQVVQATADTSWNVPAITVSFYDECTSLIPTHQFFKQDIGPGTTDIDLTNAGFTNNARWARTILHVEFEIQDYQECYEVCKEFRRCEKFNDTPANDQCRLYTENAIVKGSNDLGFVAGPFF